MTVWCKPNTILKQSHALRIAGLIALCVALITTLLFGNVSRATAGINQTLSYSGRLLTASGAVVPDGHYNIQFKIYQDGAGTSAGNPGGTLKWTETRINNGGTSGVDVTNGFFSVNLGSVNAFGSSVDWNQDTLWLSMNIAGSATACTSFDTAPCVADGEMLPMKRITSTPYAMNAGQLGGKTADNFVQLGQGVQADAGTASSIFINKTGSGNLLQLQNTGSDLFTITDTGEVRLGSGTNRVLYVGGAAADTNGDNLTLFAGWGGSGSGSNGGTLFLQGGGAGGTNGNGGDVSITGGAGAGSGNSGGVYIGADATNIVQIGASDLNGSQTINIGNNSNAGGTTNITIGSTGSATGGSTALQSKDDTTVTTDGTQRARFSGSSNTLYVGNADTSGQAATASSFTIQGTSSTGADTQGGAITLQAGSATSGNANGGNITLSGGAGVGTGATGLVVINTPTFQTTANDANCYTSGSLVASSCTITAASVNNSAAVLVGFNVSGQTATLPDPTITTAGRVIYISAATGSSDFTLSFNGGGIGNRVSLRANATATMIWNGTDWTAAGASNSTTLQSSYDNSAQAAGDPTFLITNTNSPEGLVVRNDETDQIDGSLLRIQTSAAANLLTVNGMTEYVKNGGAETAGSSSSTFPSSTWTAYGGGSSISRYTTTGDNIGAGIASTEVNTTGTWSGVMAQLTTGLTVGQQYNVSFSGRTSTGNITDLMVYYSYDDTTSDQWCASGKYIDSAQWRKITCTFTVPSVTVLSTNKIFIGQDTATSRTWYIDNLSITKTSNVSNVQVGNSDVGGPATLFTLDRMSSAPTTTDYTRLAGSMYYDTTVGKIRCYEADGWGSCGAKPDTFITISPEYSNAVTHGSDIGTLTSDFCSDTLDINDGTSSQPTVCGTNETNNFYNWTSAETSAQVKDIYVTHKLPSTFSNFVASSTSLTGRTDSSDSSVAYQVYKSTSSGLTACGSSVSVSTGSQSSWQTGTAGGSADPSACSFAAGDSIVIKITLSSLNDANAYVGNLNFAFSNE